MKNLSSDDTSERANCASSRRCATTGCRPNSTMLGQLCSSDCARAIGMVESASVTIDPRLIIGICWLAFFIAWAIMAMIYGGGGRRTNNGAEIGLRLLMVAGAYLSVRYGYALQPFGAFTERVAVAGAIVCFLGLQFGI